MLLTLCHIRNFCLFHLLYDERILICTVLMTDEEFNGSLTMTSRRHDKRRAREGKMTFLCLEEKNDFRFQFYLRISGHG